MKKILFCLMMTAFTNAAFSQQAHVAPPAAHANPQQKPSRIARAADKLIGAHDRLKDVAAGCKGSTLGVAKDLLLLTGDLSLIGLKVTSGAIGAATAVAAVVTTGGTALPIIIGLAGLGAAALDNNDLVLNIPTDIKNALSRIKPICIKIKKIMDKGCCQPKQGPQGAAPKKTFKEKTTKEKAVTVASLPFKAVKKTGQTAGAAYDKVCRVVVDMSTSACGALECIDKVSKAIRDRKNANDTLQILKNAKCCDRAAAGGNSKLRKAVVKICHDLGAVISKRRGGGSSNNANAPSASTFARTSKSQATPSMMGPHRQNAAATAQRPRGASF